ncbi:hypothetical protein PIROE2DRAFT_7885 [Piromyces sp. E2]|nr:hypothetical protein PIROE2DRAFT_7885 [Piromyces sp. E2]|eukprot:OUM65165.1 hypothetical protein PIROE2DRAFT_7885 [Piromyces sp. E2]
MVNEKNEDAVAIFIKNFKPSDNLVKPDEETLKKLSESVLPKEYINLLKNYGFGNYGNGIIKVINPFEYADNLYTWIGNDEDNKLPIMMTAFGDLFYYRKLEGEEEDICILDIHYKNIELCEYHFKDFIENYLLNEDIQSSSLRKKLFSEALEIGGELELNEIFYFVPALSIGGAESINYIKKGDANAHQFLLFCL